MFGKVFYACSYTANVKTEKQIDASSGFVVTPRILSWESDGGPEKGPLMLDHGNLQRFNKQIKKVIPLPSILIGNVISVSHLFPQLYIRREVCNGLFRLCEGLDPLSQRFLWALLKSLFTSLDTSLNIHPKKVYI